MTLQMLDSVLQAGDAVVHGGITITPIFPRRAPVARYATLDDALPLGLRIGEVDGGGAVSRLTVDNPTALDVLLYDGEELVGAKQDRILDVTVLVAAESRTTIPVSCVERGRWSRRTEHFDSGRRAANPEVRRRKSHALAAGPARPGMAQSEVWAAVAETSARCGAVSATEAQAASFEARRPDLERLRAAFPLQPGQCGAIATIGATQCLDYLSRPEAWATMYGKILDGYGLDAADGPRSAGAPGDPEAFLASIRGAATRRGPSPGRGEDVRGHGAGVVASGLVLDAELLQLSAFTTTEGDTTRIARPSRRRR